MSSSRSARASVRFVFAGLRTLTLLAVVSAALQVTEVSVGDGGYRLPWTAGVAATVTQAWGGAYSHGSDRSSYAIDIALPEGAPVRASQDGDVAYVKDDVRSDGCGGRDRADMTNRITLYHADGTATVYVHLARVVRTSGTVRRGETIGYVGRTGWTNCEPHLHFARQAQGAPITDSKPVYFDEYPNRALAAGRSYTSGNTVDISTVGPRR